MKRVYKQFYLILHNSVFIRWTNKLLKKIANLNKL